MPLLLDPTVELEGSRDGFPPCPRTRVTLCCHSPQLRTLTLSFPPVPSHVRRGGHHLVPGVRAPRDHHHELRLLALHGLDRLCPLPLRRLCHRLLLGRRADLRREPLLLRLGIQLAHPRQERSRVIAPGTPHGCRRMLWLVGSCALGLLLLTRCQAPRGRFRKAAQMSGSLKHYSPRLFPPFL